MKAFGSFSVIYTGGTSEKGEWKLRWYIRKLSETWDDFEFLMKDV